MFSGCVRVRVEGRSRVLEVDRVDFDYLKVCFDFVWRLGWSRSEEVNKEVVGGIRWWFG